MEIRVDAYGECENDMIYDFKLVNVTDYNESHCSLFYDLKRPLIYYSARIKRLV